MKLTKITTESGESYMMAVDGGDEFIDESLPKLPFKLTVTNCKEWFEGEFTRKDIDSAVASLKMDRASYYQYIREAFFDLADESKCVFSIEKMDLVKKVKFVWKRLVEPGNIKYQLGSVKLREENSEDVVKRLLLTVMTQLDKNSARIAQLEKERDRLASDREETLSTLTKCVDMKQNMEKELFGKFIAVLNEKKTFIRTLENGDSTQMTMSSREMQSPPPPSVASTSGVTKTVASRDDGDLLFDDFGGDDDDGPIRRKPRTVKTKEKRKMESTNSNASSNSKPADPPPPPKFTRRSTRGDSDPSNLLDML